MFLAFPFVLLHAENLETVKEKILQKAAEMFLQIGVKSVTMDEIAAELGMSKKTIYAHFPTKTKLIEATTFYVFEEISNGIDQIKSKHKNPIEEHFVIKNFALRHLKNEKSSPQFQLQKYYPALFGVVKDKQQTLLEGLIKSNLDRGVKEGYYRKEIDVPFICRIYFIEIMGIKDRDLFPESQFRTPELVEKHLEYHLRAIVTEKGLSTLEDFLKNNN